MLGVGSALSGFFLRNLFLGVCASKSQPTRGYFSVFDIFLDFIELLPASFKLLPIIVGGSL